MQDVLNQLNQVVTLSTAALTFAACIVLGYMLRFIKKFPNDGIPLAVILTGCINMILMADPKTTTMPTREWVTRHLIAGAVIGFVAWMAHKLVISKLEDFLSSKFEVVSNLLSGANKTPPTPPSPPTPPTNP